jgi:hypothetical protein
VLFSYFTRKIADSIYDRMILKAFAICNRVEKYSTTQEQSQITKTVKPRETADVA